MRQFNTLTGFLLSTSSSPTTSDTVEFQGFTSIGDGYTAKFQHNGIIGQTASQSPIDLGLATPTLNDADGNQWVLINGAIQEFNDVLFYPAPFGDSGKGLYSYLDYIWVKLSDTTFISPITTTDLINSSASFSSEVNITTTGFTTSGDGGSGSWIQNGVTGQTASQSPSQLGDALLNDANGDQWVLIINGGVLIASKVGAFPDTGLDTSGEIKAAVASGASTVDLEAGLYNYDSTDNINVISKSLVGKGMGLTNIRVDTGPSVVFISGDGAKLQALSLLNNAQINIGTGDGIKVDRVEVDNSEVTLQSRRSGVFVLSDAQLDGLIFTNNHIHDVSIGFYTDSSFGSDIGGIFGYAKNTIFKNNRIGRTRKAGVSFNADGDVYTIPNNPWNTIAFSGNTIYEYLGDATLNRSIAVGGDFMTGLSVNDNTISGYGGAGTIGAATNFSASIHIEDNCFNTKITTNTITDCVKAIEVYDRSVGVVISGNIAEGREGHVEGDDVSLFDDPTFGYSTSTGISYCVSVSGGTSSAEEIRGNRVKNFNLGYLVAASIDGGVVSSNAAILCSAALQVGNFATSSDISNITASNCKFAVSVGSDGASSGIIKNMNAIGCFDVVSFIGGNEATLQLNGLTYTKALTSVTNAVTTNHDLFLLPDVMDVNINSYIRNNVLPSKSTSKVSALWDGATMTSSKALEVKTTSDAVIFSGSNPVIDAIDRLEARLFNSTGATATATVTLTFDGYMVYSS